MAFQKMTSREQVLILIVVATFVGGAYGLFRYMPQNKRISAQAQQLEQDKQKIKNPVFPEEPEDDIETLTDQNETLSEQIASAKTTLASYERNLAPTDGQDTILKVSDAARTSGVKVTENIPYIVQRKEAETASKNKPKISARMQRKLDKEARKRAQKQGGQLVSADGAIGGVPKEGELIYHLANDLESARPFQQLTLEGSFYDLQKFIQALSNMQYQITIVKMDIEMKIENTIAGTPQVLQARMVIAL